MTSTTASERLLATCVHVAVSVPAACAKVSRSTVPTAIGAETVTS